MANIDKISDFQRESLGVELAIRASMKNQTARKCQPGHEIFLLWVARAQHKLYK